MDTIYALASSRGKSGVSVIRVSGPNAAASAKTLGCNDLPGRRAVLRMLRDASGARVDQALVIRFPEGESFTGEETVEFQVHGSVAVVQALLRILGEQPGLRLAEPGEFTRRALENERLDLVQVEGLADLIEAETEAQRKQALRVTAGDLARLVEGWRSNLVRAVALIEATIDFADEEVPVDVSPEVTALIDGIVPEMEQEVRGSLVSERIREGFEVAILGAPNIGKSTLLNALAGRDAAITSDVEGTTRDVIEVRMDLMGLPVTLLDTAGIRDSEDHVERIGVDRGLKRAADADLRVVLTADGRAPDHVSLEPDDLLLIGKVDLTTEKPDHGRFLGVSGKTGEGLDRLVEAIGQRLEKRAVGSATATRERHRMAISDALTYIAAARPQISAGPVASELAAEELHQAIRALDILIGRVDVEQVLDVIFESFCLGK